MKNLVEFLLEAKTLSEKEVFEFINKWLKNTDTYDWPDTCYYVTMRDAVIIFNFGKLNGQEIVGKLHTYLDKYDGEVGFGEGSWEDMDVFIDNVKSFTFSLEGGDLTGDNYEKVCYDWAQNFDNFTKVSKSEFNKLLK